MKIREPDEPGRCWALVTHGRGDGGQLYGIGERVENCRRNALPGLKFCTQHHLMNARKLSELWP